MQPAGKGEGPDFMYRRQYGVLIARVTSYGQFIQACSGVR
jgi:hypothetical protein